MNSECDLCGEDFAEGINGEVLGFDHRPMPTGEDFWRVAKVCDHCRERTLMPALRALFEDGALNLEPATEDDRWELVTTEGTGAAFFAFTTEAGTTHVARRVRARISSPREFRCQGFCGIEAGVDPEPRERPLSARREGIVVCSRCARSAPQYTVGGGR